MNIKRTLPKLSSLGYQREQFGFRNDPVALSKPPQKISKSDKICRSVASYFKEEEGCLSSLSDEISKATLSFVIGESRAILASGRVTSAHWNALSEFLAKELGVFLDLKRQMSQAQRDCEEVLKVAEEVCESGNGDVSPNRILEVAMELQEAKMRRENLRARVKSMIDGLCSEILAGNSSSDSLEIRLRGVLGKLR